MPCGEVMLSVVTSSVPLTGPAAPGWNTTAPFTVCPGRMAFWPGTVTCQLLPEAPCTITLVRSSRPRPRCAA